MATPPTAKIDIPLMLWRLVPMAEFHWKASGWGTYADIGEWRSLEIKKPSEAEVYVEWDVYLVEQVKIKHLRQAHFQPILDAACSSEGVPFNRLDHEQLSALLFVLLMRVGGLGDSGTIKPLHTWLNGHL